MPRFRVSAFLVAISAVLTIGGCRADRTGLGPPSPPEPLVIRTSVTPTSSEGVEPFRVTLTIANHESVDFVWGAATSCVTGIDVLDSLGRNLSLIQLCLLTPTDLRLAPDSVYTAEYLWDGTELQHGEFVRAPPGSYRIVGGLVAIDRVVVGDTVSVNWRK